MIRIVASPGREDNPLLAARDYASHTTRCGILCATCRILHATSFQRARGRWWGGQSGPGTGGGAGGERERERGRDRKRGGREAVGGGDRGEGGGGFGQRRRRGPRRR